MNTKVPIIFFSFLFSVHNAVAQGTFIYDQQSSDERKLGEQTIGISSSQPIGQSFTPALSSVGFVRLYLADPFAVGTGAVVAVNIRTSSITGTISGIFDASEL